MSERQVEGALNLVLGICQMRMTKTKEQTMTSVGEDIVKLDFSDSAHGNAKGYSCCGKQSVPSSRS